VTVRVAPAEDRFVRAEIADVVARPEAHAELVAARFQLREQRKQLDKAIATYREILDIYDAMQQAMETSMAYHTRLDPPPANGWMPPESALQVVTGRQSDGAKEDTVANLFDDIQRHPESEVAQPLLHFKGTE